MNRPCPSITLNAISVGTGLSGRALLDQVSLTIPPGALVGIASADFHETTAVLEVLARRVMPTTGTLSYQGKQGGAPLVSATWEEEGFFQDWSLFDNLYLGVGTTWSEAFGGEHEMRAYAQTLYDAVGVPLVWHRHCAHLVPSERVIALIVRALLRPAALYLFDRTLDGLPEPLFSRVLMQLKALTVRDSTVVVATSKLHDGQQFLTQALLLSCGQVSWSGVPEALGLLEKECRLVNSTGAAKRVITREIQRERHNVQDPADFIRSIFQLLAWVMRCDQPLFCLYRDLQQREHVLSSSELLSLSAPLDGVSGEDGARFMLQGEHTFPVWQWAERGYKIIPVQAPKFWADRGTASKVVAVFGCPEQVLPFDLPLEELLEDVGVSLCFLLLDREMASEVKHRERLDSLGMMASCVAHDLNNALFAIQGAATFLQRKVGDPGLAPFLEVIMKATGTAGSLTRKLLSFSQKGTTAFQEVDLHAVITDAIHLLSSGHAKKVQFQLALNASEARMLGDAAGLKNMIVNIGLNAIQAVDEDRGRVVVATENVLLSSGSCEGDAVSPPAVHLMVSDNGPGIHPDIIDRIFEPFVSSKLASGGTGLGLAVVYGTVKEHKGHIMAKNLPGGGAQFSLSFPLSQIDAMAAPTRSSPVVAQASARLLVCDDDPLVTIVVAGLLTDLGYRVTTTAHGQECLEVFRANPDLFDLVLLDDLMPEMSGQECFHALRAITPAIKVVILSGYRRSDFTEDKVAATGIAGFLQKPIHLEELAAALKRVLGTPDAPC